MGNRESIRHAGNEDSMVGNPRIPFGERAHEHAAGIVGSGFLYGGQGSFHLQVAGNPVT
jgi:hypothetical protein